MWIVKWFNPLPADGRVYLQRYNLATETAYWVHRQKSAARYENKSEALSIASMWSDKAARPVRLVPRKKP